MEKPEEQPQEETKLVKQISSEARGLYVVFESPAHYDFTFPINSNLLKNFEILSFLKDEVGKAIELQKQKETEKKEEEKCECKK